MTMYVVSHKAFQLPSESGYKPIYVGSSMREKVAHEASFQKNIAEKNPYFCELTALYAIWKHGQDEIVGISHYRRFFAKKKRKGLLKYALKHQVYSESDWSHKLSGEYDLILPSPMKLSSSVLLSYRKDHYLDDLLLVREIISKGKPEGAYFFDQVMASGEFHGFNMLIATKEVFHSYCSWLFPILFSLEERLDLKSRSSYQQRVYGFIAERLLDVWLLKERSLSYLEVPTITLNDKPFVRGI
ncbi:DUF4422 domain-containing protein [Agarivorans sp. 1_MG-2023]|uniref:DUF4422 domain-containing protein n=1 Tax=Agarivorans sp. 1_MG-2023 TaxID=3062634 RepID=UPI0026E182B4|nr:DUF4422 domain-containing protein [Agarivorans sp. 1_MG-2023]MDO6764335.1 DUF4422 domain-containing protein [Agarivorans sp. 1_MG-2023]